MDIVNGVIGAARRENVDHAFLVTTSGFSPDVQRRVAELRELRLHLKDGEDIVNWLRSYQMRSEGGLWIDADLDASIRP